MDGKVMSFYNAFFRFAKEDAQKNPAAIPQFLSSVLRIDFDEFVNCWEYLLIKYEKLLDDPQFDRILTADTLALLASKSAARAVKTLLNNPAIAKAVYAQSVYSCEGVSLELLAQLLVSQKIAEAEELIKCVQKNTAGRGYGQRMVAITDKLFFELLKKQGNVSKKVDLPRKTANLLLTYIAKIRGPERGLLEQRIREIL